MHIAHYPTLRARRLRSTDSIRALVRETWLMPQDLIFPLFIRHGNNVRKAIASMPGQYQVSIDEAIKDIQTAFDLGIRAVILFGIPETKDAVGSENSHPDGIIPSAIRAIKDAVPGMVVISDMCMCEYTEHGHCGILNSAGEEYFCENLPEGYVLNDLTLESLAKASVEHARAGADLIAPSGMIDGMVAAIRSALDANGFELTGILSYASKFASGFYGPFRDAAESPPRFGNRAQYQMDPANYREAIKETLMDVDEGADMIIVKPALPYLDVLSGVRQSILLPLVAYQVSGEYAMLQAAGQNGWLDLKRCTLESLTCIKRAGADLIITYFALEVARWLREDPS